MASDTMNHPESDNTNRNSQRPRLSADQFADAMKLVQQAKTVELKLTVAESAYRPTALALGLDVMKAQLRQVVFFDTPDLDVNKSGLVGRARRTQRGPDDTVIKLRPVIPSNPPAELWKLPEFGVEIDAMPGAYVCSASSKAKLDKKDVRSVTLGKRRVSSLFSSGQRRFLPRTLPTAWSSTNSCRSPSPRSSSRSLRRSWGDRSWSSCGCIPMGLASRSCRPNAARLRCSRRSRRPRST